MGTGSFNLEKIDEYRWEIPRTGKMNVHGIIFVDEELKKAISQDKSLEQVINVAGLPGIVKASLAMPDIHWGYGFPIGGVAAFDMENGIISPGGVGYDINCISGNSKVLHRFGYTQDIEGLNGYFGNREINCFNLSNFDKETAKIKFFLKKEVDTKIFEVITISGKHIIATEDHPFYTPSGFLTLNKINVGSKVAVTNFEGVPYEEPSDEIIVSEEDIINKIKEIKKGNPGNSIQQVIKFLEKLQILPIRYNSPILPYLTKSVGFVLGDGTLYFEKRVPNGVGCGKGITGFFGKPEDLEDIRKDILLWFTPSKIYSRSRIHKIKTEYGLYEFDTIENSFKVVSTAFAIILHLLGVPVGKKSSQNFEVPNWIFKAPLWQKRLFLASFFGAEMSSPKVIEEHNSIFYCPILSIQKRRNYVESGIKFLKGLEGLLNEFGVKVLKISEREAQINSDGSYSTTLRMILDNSSENLINLWGKIGFEYNRERSYLSSVAISYLINKIQTIDERNNIQNKIIEIREATGVGVKKIFETLDNTSINLRFIERTIYEGKRESRVSLDFEGFEVYKNRITYGLGKSGFIWDEVIEKIQRYDIDTVYDITLDNSNHNFIAEGFLIHNCGVRLLRTNLKKDEVLKKIKDLTFSLFNGIPTGLGSSGAISKLSRSDEQEVIKKGAKWAVEHGFGIKEDLEFIEEYGTMEGADPSLVSDRAYERGRDQVGTLGSGNHFIEVDIVSEIFEPDIAKVFGLEKDKIAVLIHTGSRGFGYQVCDDYLKLLTREYKSFGIELTDRQLACAPIKSKLGQDYYSAMVCAVNYAKANRQVITHLIRNIFERLFKISPKELGMSLVYDVAHNIAKFEEHEIDGKKIKVCVHRKGATRAFPANRPEVPSVYRSVGQPVLIPGDMGRSSFVLVGTDKAMEETFGSTCHGAGRVMSRHAAMSQARGKSITRELEEKGIVVIAREKGTLAEEMSEAYKNIEDVVDVVASSGISKKVAKLRPIGVIKG